LNSLLESNTTFLIRLDLEGNYTYVNDSFCKKFGYLPQDILGKNYISTVHPEDIIKCSEIGLQIIQHPHQIHKTQIRKPNPTGGYIETEWEYVTIQNHEGKIKEIQGVGRDISDQKKMILELEEERNYLEMTIWGGRLGTFDWNLEKNEIRFNERWADMMGYENKPQTLSFSEWEMLIHPNDLTKVKESFDLLIQDERSYFEIEYRTKTTKGKQIWLRSTGKVIEKNKKKRNTRIIGILQDISETKEAETRIKTIENRNNSIVSMLNEGILIQNMKGEIISCNASAEKIFGLTFHQMKGKSSLDSIFRTIKEDGSHLPGEEHPAMKSIATGKIQTDVVMGVIKPNGETTWINAYSYLLFDDDTHTPYAVFSIFYDFTSRKKIEEELRKNKELLNETEKIAHIGGWELNYPTKKLQWTEETFILHEFEQRITPNLDELYLLYDAESRIELKKAIDELEKSGKNFDLELQLQLPSGHIKWVRVIGKAKYENNKVSQIIGSIQNISQIKNQAIQIQNEKDRLAGIIEGTDVGTWEWEIKTDKTIFNERWASMLGYTLDELDPISIQTWIDLTHPDDLIKANENLQKHFKHETQYYETKLRMRHKNGDWVWILDRGKVMKRNYIGEPLLMSGIHMDITAAKVLEDELKKLSMVAERTSNAVVVTDYKGRINWVNESFTRITGYHLDEVKGKKPKELFQYEGTDPETKLYLSKKLANKENVNCEIRNIGKHGNEYWLYLEIKAIFDSFGNHTGFMAVETDITESIKSKQALKFKNDQLMNINKELEQFVYIASHDLQEPLLTIKSCAEIITNEAGETLNPEMRIYLDFISKSSERLKELIKGLMQYSRIGREKKIENVNIQELLTDVKKDLDYSIEESSAVIKFEHLPIIEGHPTELRLLFQNLLSNAIKFRTKTKQPIIQINCKEDSEYWTFTVADNGIGIEQKNLEKVFIIFKRLHNRDEYDGTGIGLAHCKKIIDLHGGKIWMESEINKGTKVLFCIPKLQSFNEIAQ
ncbi:MAG: PAS domain-containing sensor histidine kinase, partial [Bacteroidia bacterium]